MNPLLEVLLVAGGFLTLIGFFTAIHVFFPNWLPWNDEDEL